LIDDVAAVLTLVRRAKSDAKASMRADISTATVTAPPDALARIDLARADIAAAGRIADLSLVEGSAIEVDATLADEG